MYTVWHNVCENNYSHIVVCTNNFSHMVVYEKNCTQCFITYFYTQCITKNLQYMEPCPPNEFWELALGASQAIFRGWGGIRGGQGIMHTLCLENGWPQRTMGSRLSRSAHAGALCNSTGLCPSRVYCNDCLQQPMPTFLYCESHESQQWGKTPTEKFW